MLNAVLDGGADLIDTSIDHGRSEELIARVVSHPAGPRAGARSHAC
ncbi:MAG TPA: hypothetical protein VMD59_05080 [Acidimicrobiales bacterium]|nr:hypothetical protein [Acidimicrobiales bacterium]